MASLHELQYSFAAALRDPATTCAVHPAANLDVYRHNGETQFAGVLGISFPVLKRRVGEEYFRQLAHHYRHAHPSRSGDLQWVGREFSGFLADHLRDSAYAWLADLARLEWARELSSIAEIRPAPGAEVLARFAPEQLEAARFALQPSLNLVSSPFPVFSVWLANQLDSAPPVDQSKGPEAGMTLQRFDGVEVRSLAPGLFSYLCELHQGATLGEAVSRAGLDEPALLAALRFLFAEQLVCDVSA